MKTNYLLIFFSQILYLISLILYDTIKITNFKHKVLQIQNNYNNIMKASKKWEKNSHTIYKSTINTKYYTCLQYIRKKYY